MALSNCPAKIRPNLSVKARFCVGVVSCIRILRMATDVINGSGNHTNGSTVMEMSNGTPTKKLRLTTQQNGSSTPMLRFAKLTEHASTPTRGSKLAAGFDLYSAYDYIVPGKGKMLAKTDIQIAVPDGCYGRVAPRSGLAHKHFIDVGAGVIDQDYRGNVGVILFNFGEQEFEVKKGDRIAQLIMERIHLPELEECQTLDETERGEGGFGSTGKS